MALRILIVILLLAVPLELPGCGPFLPEAIFHLVVDPEAPADFARGQLGILQPTYERLYQVIAYRYLAGVGLNGGEQKAVLPPPPVNMDAPAPSKPNPWLEARNQVPGVTPLADLDAYRQVQKQGYFDTYLNCNDDAFRTAASTLDRIRKSGAPVPDWIAAQDAVFADCSKGAAMPAAASDPRLRSDRAYQIASAKFYSGQYDAARQDFQAIAADSSSPWRGSAPYLAARCLIRAGRYAEAETALQKVADDPATPRWHAPANGLLGYVRWRLHPPQRMHQLALALVKPNSEATIGQDLIDYRFLWDGNIKPDTGDELTDWIRTFQAGGAGALEKWRAHRSLPWLVAALQAASPRDSALPELLSAAAEVKTDSAGYLTVNYHRVRLLPAADARTLADQLLNGNLPQSSRNQFRAQRMRLARNFDEFLRYAPRRPVAEMTYELSPVTAKEEYLDSDSAQIFNSALPLSYLKQAAASTALPDQVRKALQRDISVRTLLLSEAPPFDQVFALMKAPGDQPFLQTGYGRNTKEVDKIDSFRDNWWCSPGAPDVRPEDLPIQPDVPPAPFLSAAEQAQAKSEVAKLRAVATGPDWLTAQTIAFAQSHPQDTRVPEALALAVHATRYGCSDAQTGDLSKRAFDLLHSRYATSEWAKKTPYWYQ